MISSKSLTNAKYLKTFGCADADSEDQHPGVYFTLVTKPPKSFLKWFSMMAKKYDYVKAIRRKSKHLSKHRDEQKIEILQNYKKCRFWIF